MDATVDPVGAERSKALGHGQPFGPAADPLPRTSSPIRQPSSGAVWRRVPRGEGLVARSPAPRSRTCGPALPFHRRPSTLRRSHAEGPRCSISVLLFPLVVEPAVNWCHVLDPEVPESSRGVCDIPRRVRCRMGGRVFRREGGSGTRLRSLGARVFVRRCVDLFEGFLGDELPAEPEGDQPIAP